MSIGKTIREARMRKGWNQSELAKRAGVRPQSVQQWECGKTGPKRNRWPKVAKALDLDESQILWSEYEELIRLLKALSEPHRQILVQLAYALLDAKRGKKDPESLQESRKRKNLKTVNR